MGRVVHQLLGSVVDSIELSYFVTISDSLEKHSDIFLRSGKLEIVLCDTHFCEGRWEEEINCFRFITIVLKRN